MNTLDTPTLDETSNQHASLQEEASRLAEFKKQNVKRQNQTPCPACATYVHINANKCPHCSSDIAANNALVRESLRRLDEVNADLDTLHTKHMRRHKATARPFSEQVRSFVTPQMRDDMKIIVPSFFLLFVVLVALRFTGIEPLFWSITIAGGFIAYSLLNKSNMRRFVTIDLYRSVLVIGLLIVMGSALPKPAALLSWGTASSVEVQRPVANIRASSSTDSRIVTTAQQGDNLQVITRRGDWYHIKTSDGQTGWVYASLVKK
ncbi:MAG: SH3 domain-containing protein [Candidatus Krumholzibacteria bacterium]|nr:SH3 domain-containing protein [Candidatus Krumholzibacteria bacterium]